MTKIKICGITSIEDAKFVAGLGADAMGFVFYKKSSRYVSASRARRITETIPPFVGSVGVFVNESIGRIRDIANFCALDAVQLHGDEDHHFCHRLKRYGFKIIKAFRVGPAFDPRAVRPYRVDALLFDTERSGVYGGSGEPFDRALIKRVETDIPVILSGGLTPRSVADEVRAIQPYAVDVSSGVEKEPGKKAYRLVDEFIKNVRAVC